MANSKKHCFICKNYIPNAEVIKTNVGYACKSCLGARQIKPRKPIKRKTSTDKPKKKKALKRKIKPKSLKQQCDELWAECVKARAGYKSEISGYKGKQIDGEYVLNAHHLQAKGSYRLRYELNNGMCLTKGEHNFQAHGPQDRQYKFREKVKVLRGEGIYDKLYELKNQIGGTDLMLIKIYLEQELKRHKSFFNN